MATRIISAGIFNVKRPAQNHKLLFQFFRDAPFFSAELLPIRADLYNPCFAKGE
jgi:hypothetical protein